MNNEFLQNLSAKKNLRAERRHSSYSSRKISKPCKAFAIFVCSIIAIPIVGSIIVAIARCF